MKIRIILAHSQRAQNTHLSPVDLRFKKEVRRAGRRSVEAEALGRILTDLGCVQSLQTVLEEFTGLAARIGREFGEKCLLNGEQMTGRVVDLTEQAFVAAGAIAAFEGECGLAGLLARMDFARELTRLFRRQIGRAHV